MKNKIKIGSAFSVILVFICMLLAGSFLVPKLPIKLNPSVYMPTINVKFNMNKQSARVVEMEVTSRLEGMLGRVDGVHKVSSLSSKGQGNITLEIDKDKDLNVVRFELSTVIRQVYPLLPKGTSYPSININKSNKDALKPFLNYIVNAPSDPVEIKKYLENQMVPSLSMISGIDEINVYGASPMIWNLKYDYYKLQHLGVSPSDIKSSISEYLNKEFLGLGIVEKDNSYIRLVLAPDIRGDSLRLSSIIVKNKEGRILRLSDLVSVEHIQGKQNSYQRINGLNSINIYFTAKKNANQINLATKIKSRLEDLMNRAPDGYEFHLAYDATEYINTELNKIYKRSGLTVLILLLFVFLIYRSFNYLLMIIISLMCNLGIAAIFYYLCGIEIQIYSLVGITISLTLIIDNMIVMADQIVKRNNMKAFLAILAATLTTISSLVIIFFLPDKIRLNLQDFAIVLIINLLVSLFVSLFLIPALISRMRIIEKKLVKKAMKKDKRMNNKNSGHFFMRRRRWIIKLFYVYRMFILWFSCHKWIAIILIILLFGLPVFMLPDKLGENNNDFDKGSKKELTLGQKVYNSTFGSDFYQERMKSTVDVVLGGTLRLFIQNVYNGSYWSDKSETIVSVNLDMPIGATIEQSDFIIRKMESYLRQFPQIKQFNTDVRSDGAFIQIYFTKENQTSIFPYKLKYDLIFQALTYGAGTWRVDGVGKAFNNDDMKMSGSCRIKMSGYNYDDLYFYARHLRDNLLAYRRIKEVVIDYHFTSFKKDYKDFCFDLKKRNLTYENIYPKHLYTSLTDMFMTNNYCGYFPASDGYHQIYLSSNCYYDYDIWHLKNMPLKIGDSYHKLSDLAKIDKHQSPESIAKENQQYLLCLQFEYIGNVSAANRVVDENVKKMRDILPLGYSCSSEDYNYSWKEKDNKQYLLILLIVAIIYFTTSILFDSLTKPFLIISIIPISFIGIFLTFYWFDLNFDQGGFTAFIMLCGLTVNASIYIINEYINVLKVRPNISRCDALIKAINAKVIPIFLTTISTIIGFIPFIIGEKEGFWFPLAAGTIGGLFMSLLGIFIFLPGFMKLNNKSKKLSIK